MLIDKRRFAGLAAAILAASGAIALGSGTPAAAADCGYLFDDFHYNSSADTKLSQ